MNKILIRQNQNKILLITEITLRAKYTTLNHSYMDGPIKLTVNVLMVTKAAGSE